MARVVVGRGAGGLRGQARVDVFAPAGDGLYERVTTRHRQRHFPPEVVRLLLAGAGLRLLAVHGVLPDCSLADPADESRDPKVLYTASRMEGGDAA